MFRFIDRKNLQVIFGLVLALGIVATRSEKLFVEMQVSLPHEGRLLVSSADHALPDAFDPARVPLSGGMAARLLAGVSVKLI